MMPAGVLGLDLLRLCPIVCVWVWVWVGRWVGVQVGT